MKFISIDKTSDKKRYFGQFDMFSKYLTKLHTKHFRASTFMVPYLQQISVAFILTFKHYL